MSYSHKSEPEEGVMGTLVFVAIMSEAQVAHDWQLDCEVGAAWEAEPMGLCFLQDVSTGGELN